MARPPEDWDPSGDELEELNEDENYEDEEEQQPASSRLPLLLSLAGLLLWFVPCSLVSGGSIVLGILAHRKARQEGQSQVFPMVVWIGGIVFLVVESILFFT